MKTRIDFLAVLALVVTNLGCGDDTTMPPPDSGDVPLDDAMDGGEGGDGDDGADRPDTADGCPDMTLLGADMDLESRVGIAVVTATTVGAGDEWMPSCDGNPSAPDLVYSWTAPSDGRFVFDLDGSSYDTVLALQGPTACGVQEVDCNDDSGFGTESRVAVDLTMGAMVMIVVDGHNGAAGDFVLNIITGAAADETGLCQNMIDDDRDGWIDCFDPDCSTEDFCFEVGFCDDGADNDGDGDTDCADTECRFAENCTETGPECLDGTDNDGDTIVDCMDSDCLGDDACVETGMECDDVDDNDLDFATDCTDSDCAREPQCSETPAQCGDTMDNDGDGNADCADSDCLIAAGCDSCPDGNLGMATGMAVVMDTTAGGTDRRDGRCRDSTAPEKGYSFRASVTGLYTFDTAGSSFDTVVYVRDGSCNGLELGCNDDIEGGPTTSSVTVALTMGQNVIVFVDGYRSRNGAFRLNIARMASTIDAPAVAGALVITEIAQDPAGPEAASEWIELYNPGATALSLRDCVISDRGADTHVIASDVVVQPLAYVALASGASPGFEPSYVYAGFRLDNMSDEVILECGGVEIDRVAYDGGLLFPQPTGRTMNLDSLFLDATANDEGNHWCTARNAFGRYDNLTYGTPGASNPSCG